MDKLQAVRAFLQVARAGSFVKAAADLEVSTTSASRLVKELETHLGVRLFNRSTRELSRTDAGEVLFERYAKLLDEMDAAETEVASDSDAVAGRLRVALPHAFATRIMAPVLRRYRTENPGVFLDIALGDEHVDLVRDGFDVALRITPKLEQSLIARRLFDVRMVVCASPDYLARHGTPQTPDDLAGHHCLLYASSYPSGEWRFRPPGGTFATQRVNGLIRANNGEMLRAFAVTGDGIACEPEFLLRDDIAAGRLVPILTEFELPGAAAYAIYSSRSHLPRKVRAFIDLLASELRGGEAAPAL